MRSTSTLALAATLATAAIVAGTFVCDAPAQAGKTDEERAAELLKKAMELAQKSSYQAAHTTYRSIAKRYPATRAGMIAAARSGDTAFVGWSFMVENGPSANRADVAVLGDSFTLSEQNRFDDMAKQVPKLFEKHKLFGEYFTYFNFLRVNVASADGDVDGYGREYDTALDSKIMGRDAPWVVVSHQRVMEALDQVPEHDRLALVLVKAQGFHGTGGAGVGVVAGRQDDTIIHEWGHAFGGLEDEYTNFTFERGAVGRAPNVSTSDDPAQVPWHHWLDAKAPGIGVYRGGAGRLDGAWKPVASSCAMESGQQFCKVCTEALVLRLYSLVDPIDGCDPPAHPTAGRPDRLEPDRSGSYQFAVTLLQPDTHGLDVSWWVLDEAEVPRPVREGALRDRRQRGRLGEITARPQKHLPTFRGREHRFQWTPERGQTGRVRVVCRVRDTTEVAGQSWPWVLKDEHGVLESERGWWVELGQ